MSIETSEALTPIEAGWIAVMRNVLPADLNGLCLAPDDWYRGMGMPSSGGRCLAWFDLVADECVVLTVGAYFDGTRTVVGRLHSQFLTLDTHSRRIPQQTIGGPITEQAVKACEWFTRIRRRPVERRDWSSTVHEYRFADDGAGLVASGHPAARRRPPHRVVRVDTRVG